MRANALLGRVFEEAETQPGRDRVAVLSYGFWREHFNLDAGVVGRRIELDQHTYTIIGVMPKALQYPLGADLLLPLAPDAAQLGNRSAHDSLVIGRLCKGVTVAEAQAELNVIAERLAQMYPATNRGWSVKMEPLLDTVNGPYTPRYMELIQGATLFVLLVVCLNIANLQLARGIARQPEIAMRTALGASRWRLMRQLLTECLLLGLLGAAGGLLVAKIDLQFILLAMPERVARYVAGWSNIELNGRALAYSLLLAVGAGLVSGFAPALAALRINLVDQLKSGSRSIAGTGRSRWVRNGFTVLQIAVAVMLVIGAALMADSMVAMTHTADRYNPGQMLIFNAHMPIERYDTPEKLSAFESDSLAKLRALPACKARS
jgi:putative ABC transport system permease protein